MFKRKSLLIVSCQSFIIAAILLFIQESTVLAQQQIVGYEYYKVLSSQDPRAKSPFQVRADISGGQIKVQINHTRTCAEQAVYTWSFNRALQRFRKGDTFTITTRVGVSGNCNRHTNPWAITGGGLIPSVIRRQISKAENNARPLPLVSKPNTEATRGIYGKRDNVPYHRIGAGSDRYAFNENAPILFFVITFNSASNMEYYQGYVVYFFRAIYSDTRKTSKTFNAPMFRGYRLDWCSRWATNCGKGAADRFCRSQGFSQASSWAIDYDIGLRSPTYVIETGQICKDKFCDGFKYITCK
jgi:hypothetical protein